MRLVPQSFVLPLHRFISQCAAGARSSEASLGSRHVANPEVDGRPRHAKTIRDFINRELLLRSELARLLPHICGIGHESDSNRAHVASGARNVTSVCRLLAD